MPRILPEKERHLACIAVEEGNHATVPAAHAVSLHVHVAYKATPLHQAAKPCMPVPTRLSPPTPIACPTAAALPSLGICHRHGWREQVCCHGGTWEHGEGRRCG